MKLKPEFKTGYKRTQKLSDPFCDYKKGDLDYLIDKNLDSFDWTDYQTLLGPYLPAGTYEEVIYFLPFAFTYLKEHENDAYDLVDAVFGFCSRNFGNLSNDGLSDITEKKVIECLELWTEDFKIINCDKEKCKQRQLKVDYFDYIAYANAFKGGILSLVKHNKHRDIAVNFIKQLANHKGDTTKASWFLEYASIRFNKCNLPAKCQPIKDLVFNKDLRNLAFETVMSENRDIKSKQTYWQDVSCLLNFNKL